MVVKVVSSGQAGVERAALDVAATNDIATGGWCPKGRLAEDGVIANVYPLVECDSPSVTKAMEANVRDSDGTLILSWGDLAGGTLKMVAIAARMKKPVFVVDMKQSPEIAGAEAWATRFHTKVLHVAGQKPSEIPTAYAEAYQFLKALLVG